MDRTTPAPAGAAFTTRPERADPMSRPGAGGLESGRPEEYGLALSGGGYRATLFHLGALTRLNELELLGKLDRISTVSGGSLMAGFLALAWSDLDFDAAGRASNFDSLVAALRRHAGWIPVNEQPSIEDAMARRTALHREGQRHVRLHRRQRSTADTDRLLPSSTR